MHRRRRVHDELRKSSPLAHLMSISNDAALQRQFEQLTAAEYDSSRGFRKAWDRFMVTVFVGR